MIAAIWIVTALGLVLWSLLVWTLHAVLSLAPGWAGDLKPWLDEVPMQDWLEGWLPGWRGLAEACIDLMEAMLALVGGFIQASAPWLVWGGWAAGALVMLAFAGVLHVIVRAATRPAAAVAVR